MKSGNINSVLIATHRVVLKWHMHSMHLLDASRGRVWRAEAELEAASQRVCKWSPQANKLFFISRIQDSPGPTRVNKPSLWLNPVSHLFLHNWWANNFTFFKWVGKNQRKSNISRHVKTNSYVSAHTILLHYSHSHWFIYCLKAGFVLQEDRIE